MRTDGECISREAAIAAIYGQHIGGKEACENARPNTYGADLREIVADIEDIPAADVRHVVLCRDCVNYVENGEANGEKMCVIDAEWRAEYGYYYGVTAYTPPDWFCAGGKKREES